MALVAAGKSFKINLLKPAEKPPNEGHSFNRAYLAANGRFLTLGGTLMLQILCSLPKKLYEGHGFSPPLKPSARDGFSR